MVVDLPATGNSAGCNIANQGFNFATRFRRDRVDPRAANPSCSILAHGVRSVVRGDIPDDAKAVDHERDVACRSHQGDRGIAIKPGLGNRFGVQRFTQMTIGTLLNSLMKQQRTGSPAETGCLTHAVSYDALQIDVTG